VVSNMLDLDVAVLLEARGHDIGLNSLKIDVRNLSLITVEDLSDLLQGWALGLNVEDRDEDKLEEDPALKDVSLAMWGIECR
jgi:hypothetical protein